MGEQRDESERRRRRESERATEKGVKAERRKPRKCGGATGETRQKERRVPEGAEGRTRGRLSFVCLAIWTSFAKTFPRRRENGRSLKETPRKETFLRMRTIYYGANETSFKEWRPPWSLVFHEKRDTNACTLANEDDCASDVSFNSHFPRSRGRRSRLDKSLLHYGAFAR